MAAAMITVGIKGDLSNIKKFLNDSNKNIGKSILDKYGQEGVEALRAATPKRTGKTSESWSYEIEKDPKGIILLWKNSNVIRGQNIALLIQYGHGTGWGTYVKGRDYINPALNPIFDKIAEDIGKEVNNK